MKVDPSDLSKLQALFLELAQAMSPSDEADALLEWAKKDSFFKEYFFVPDASSRSFSYTAEFLTDLGKKGEVRDSVKKADRSHLGPPLEPIHRESTPLEFSSLLTRMEKFLDQVRQASRALPGFSSYANMAQNDPRVVHFRDTLKALKPKIDELIEAVSRGDKHSAGDESLPAHHFSRTKESPFSKGKGLPFPKNIPNQDKSLKGHVTYESKMTEAAPSKGNLSHSSSLEEQGDKKIGRPQEKSFPSGRQGEVELSSFKPQIEGDRIIQGERAPSAAPFVPYHVSRDVSKKKKKKKEKNPWSFESDKDPSDPPP